MRLLLNVPPTVVKGGLLLFPGGDGADAFQVVGGVIHLGNNFLVRTSRDFARRGFAVAIVDTPSDHASAMSDAFRTSAEHAQDTEKVIDFLTAQGIQPVYLVGTSRGILSVMYLGTVLADSRMRGIVVTSSMGHRFLNGIALSKIPVPVLVVHHRDDQCRATPYEDAAQLSNALTSSPRVSFVEVLGGSAPRSTPCEALSEHGFLGMEAKVVRVITDWLSGGLVPARIEP